MKGQVMRNVNCEDDFTNAIEPFSRKVPCKEVHF